MQYCKPRKTAIKKGCITLASSKGEKIKWQTGQSSYELTMVRACDVIAGVAIPLS